MHLMNSVHMLLIPFEKKVHVLYGVQISILLSQDVTVILCCLMGKLAIKYTGIYKDQVKVAAVSSTTMHASCVMDGSDCSC
jgi:cobalamin biosynthesis protein CbiD